MKKYEYILFDLDGTLTDPKVGITKSIQYALAKYDIKVDDLDSLNIFIGPPLRDTFKEYYSFNEEKVEQAIKYFREYFSEKGMYENEVYSDIPMLLEDLKKKGKILIVATSKVTIFAEKILEHFNLDKYFDSVVGSNLDGTRSAKSEIIKYIISEHEIKDLSKVVMIGDRKYDIAGGKQNNIDTIGVTYGYGSCDKLRQADPTYVADSINDILYIITNDKVNWFLMV